MTGSGSAVPVANTSLSNLVDRPSFRLGKAAIEGQKRKAELPAEEEVGFLQKVLSPSIDDAVQLDLNPPDAASLIHPADYVFESAVNFNSHLTYLVPFKLLLPGQHVHR
ncbi:hypothetical protein CRM22_003491 [Opisthorchis felineus]|uniref:Uncharacterized protein n=1 Tax=Opisthorchis felineus TaxID=147828 RepID=A0A4V3SFV1_OPIFE|nr:hypothetical protein CRM22_003491 [Opisthorchis felineus]